MSGLPPTITEADFAALMSKCGIIMNDPLTDKLRIKLYRDENGKLCDDVEITDELLEKVSFITPVPKGVGVMTVAMLMYNVMVAYDMQRNR